MLRFAYAENNNEARGNSPFHFSKDVTISLAMLLTSLGVTEDDITCAAVGDHCCGDVTGESTLLILLQACAPIYTAWSLSHEPQQQRSTSPADR